MYPQIGSSVSMRSEMYSRPRGLVCVPSASFFLPMSSGCRFAFRAAASLQRRSSSERFRDQHACVGGFTNTCPPTGPHSIRWCVEPLLHRLFSYLSCGCSCRPKSGYHAWG